ncbi:hypothetical protein [Pseudomonas sp. RIT-PI-q]|uniref:hypothetical protein n=1 Tax=Pseudomonas sp. RIT-PI-q TaxID=1690247 RepID=UPI0015A75982|nr:hypothetical protein [Pseudomonas sp. RIT-PI-q]
MLAKNINDGAFQQDKRGAYDSIASKLAPTGDRRDTNRWAHTVNVGAAEGCDLLILPLLCFASALAAVTAATDMYTVKKAPAPKPA